MADDAINVSSPREGVAVVEFVGEHDLSNKDDITDLLEGLVTDNDVVVADLCSATFIDSSFLGCLLVANRHAAEQSHKLRLYVCDSPNVSNVLQVSGLAEHLTIVATLDDALA